MSDKHGKNEYTEQGTYQTGSTCPPKSHSGIIAFLLGLVIFLCGISTALGFMNIRLFQQLNDQTDSTLNAVSFSRSGGVPTTDGGEQTVLGFTGETISNFWHTYHDLPQGIFIQAVDAASDAAAKGIVPGDILLSVNGTPVTSIEELNTALHTCQLGEGVTVVIYREDGQYSFTLTVEEIS